MRKGYIQVYTGDGKGKTTAALGLGLRAVGHGLKVILIQFMKGMHTGELESIKRLDPEFRILRFGETRKFVFLMSDSERQGLALKIQEEIKILHDILQNKSCDILILDEILGCIQAGLVSVEDLLDIIDHKPDEMELVLTGRGLPEEIAERADLITEMKAVRHYMDAGVQARIGIEK
ncbi:MAG: cob(I)yrinic acid a,c-diamide adenosyltransferase [Caldicoprobacterales bacterium]|jgi:cob(I)alamin adenosyltransferase|nr:cob(I)yrinic acid a,c-diamide adenosyltransferase [Clostridiales bacterium]